LKNLLVHPVKLTELEQWASMFAFILVLLAI